MTIADAKPTKTWLNGKTAGKYGKYDLNNRMGAVFEASMSFYLLCEFVGSNVPFNTRCV